MNYFPILDSPSVSHFAAAYRDYSHDFMTTQEWEISSAAREVDGIEHDSDSDILRDDPRFVGGDSALRWTVLSESRSRLPFSPCCLLIAYLFSTIKTSIQETNLSQTTI
jgi:hypothetical protein